MPEVFPERPSSKVRVISIYATKWLHRADAPQPADPNLRLGRLSDFYTFFQDQLPRPLLYGQITPNRVAFFDPDPDADPESGVKVRRPADEVAVVDFWLFGLPADQVVAALAFDVHSPPLVDSTAEVCGVLEYCMKADLAIDQQPLERYITAAAERVGAEAVEEETQPLLPERHQIVIADDLPDREVPDEAVIKKIVFRDDPPYREEFTQMKRPEELNQSPRTLGAVTPYVSFLHGHQQFVQDSIFLSTVQAVGTASRFRQIWREAHHRVREFRREKQKQGVGLQRRQDLEALVDRLGNLEFDLTFSVEFPLMRIESFHSALYQAMDLPGQADTLSRMFTQLAGSIRSEITAIDIREREWDDYKQRWNAIAVSVLSIVGVPIGFLLAFFGVNATEVNSDWSLFDHRYLVAYAVAVSVALMPVGLILYPFLRRWWRLRRRHAEEEAGSADLPSGGNGTQPSATVPNPRPESQQRLSRLG